MPGWRGGVRKNEMLSDVEGGGLASILDVQPLFFIIKKNSNWSVTRHHANNILLTRNLPFVFVSDSRQ